MPTLSPSSLLSCQQQLVVILAYDGVNIFELGMAIEVFELANLDRQRYRVAVCAQSKNKPISSGLVQITTKYGPEILADAATIIVPGWLDIDATPPSFVIDALRKGHRAGRRLVSICSGVFLLAAADILNERRAAVHWSQAAILADRYPRISVDPNVFYVDDGNILTSAGRASGLDLCLHIICKDYDKHVMRNVARRLVIPAHRDGGQARYIPYATVGSPNILVELCAWLKTNLHKKHSVSEMAKRSHMSHRTFLRRFHEATGFSPGEWLTRERLFYAIHLLEDSDLSIENIAIQCGFGSADALRHHFRKQLGTHPTQYRVLFNVPHEYETHMDKY